MSRIFDNIDLQLGEHLKKVVDEFQTLDAAVGYFNLRGWQFFSPIIDSKTEVEGPVARILVGMTGADPEIQVNQHLQSIVNGTVESDLVDNSIARDRKEQALARFREQLMRGILDKRDYEALRTLKRHLTEGRVQIKLFTARPLHGKTYICKRQDTTNPIAAFVGSSNLTMSGLQHNYELNVDVLDWDGTHALARWFEDRWNDRLCIDITEDLIYLIDESWAGDSIPSPYEIYLKICWHLSRDVREGLAEYGVPTALQKELLDYQTSAVRTLARRIVTRRGSMLGDVVGLGKSITATAVALLLKEEYGWDTLIICPKNLVNMWQQEYSDVYELNARVIPYSMVTRELPELRRYKFVIIDESHTMRSESRQDYIQLKDYIQRNDSRVLLLTATPFNIRFKDVANQLGLFLDDDADLGLQPIAAMGKDPDFAKKVDQKTSTLGAFKRSDEADDWKRLMSDHLIRRTRSFVKRNYSKKDERGKEYLTFSSGERFYFPDRVAMSIEHHFGKTDPARIMVSEPTLDVLANLKLPRYGLARYVVADYAGTPEEIELIQKWEKASGHLSGFVLTGLYKRLSSCGNSFVISLQRHLARNEMWLYAIKNNLEIPVGSVLESMLDAPEGYVSTAEEDQDIDADSDGTGQAQSDYEVLKRKSPTGISWVSNSMFNDTLVSDIEADSEILDGLLQSFGTVNFETDSKLQALIQTIKVKYPNQKILIFTEYADTADYVASGLSNLGIEKVHAVTGNSGNPTELARKFSPHSNRKKLGAPVTKEEEIDVLVATDVLSEGQNLQDASIVVNYDLPWAIIRLIQRAGRVDRVGQLSETVEILSFFHESIEEVLTLRERIRHRLSQNAQAFGSDEKFFGTKDETAIIEGLYNGDVPEDGSEADNDASSIAYEIWMKAKELDPERAQRIEKMPDLTFATRPARQDEQDAIGVYVRTERGVDAFGISAENHLQLMTSYEALKFFECEIDTIGKKLLMDHFDEVRDLVHGPLRQPEIVAGQLTGIRKRIYNRLRANLMDMSVELSFALESIYSKPLTAEAEGRIAKALTARSDEDLATLVTALHNDGRLVMADNPGKDPIRIVCSMGVSNG